MSFAQRVAKAFVSAEKLADFEKETRKWVVECCTCGFQRNMWDLGGIKYKAYGTSYTLGRCPDCKAWRRMKVWDTTRAS